LAVALSPFPVVSELPTASVTLPSQAVDPAFEDRWNAWILRGRQHDIAVRRKARVAAIVVVAAALVVLAARLLGGGL